MKLEVRENMYIRTKNGIINKITSIKNLDERACLLNGFYINKDAIKKASYNIIDILEVGDYVNGYLVLNVLDFNDNTRILSLERIYDNKITEEDIKSIVTKDQFKNMEYRIGE
mgnify:CR=1 FL=1